MNQELIFTSHGKKRCQQRGISKLAVTIILNYGHFNYVRGAKSWSLSRTEKAFAQADLGSNYIKVEKQLGYVVISLDNKLITACHQQKRLKRH